MRAPNNIDDLCKTFILNVSTQEINGILLAAGKGTRFDPSGVQDKLQQPLQNGDKVVVAAARTMLAVLPDVIAVVRVENAVAASLRALGCTVVVCDDADRGMGASLACALRESSDASGWVIALGDMPYVQPATVAALRDALMRGSDIAVPVRNGRRGNPVAFGRERLPQLLQVEDDQGARALLHANPWTAVEVDDPGIHHDIDSPADLE